MEKKDIKSLTMTELRAQMEGMGEKPFRAAQLYEWMHRKLARGFDEMTNLPLAMIEKGGESYTYKTLHIVTL